MSEDFQVTIDGPRGEEWERIAGTRQFPVMSPLPARANLPGHENAEVFLVDLKVLDPAILAKIIAGLRMKFSLTEQEAAAEIQSVGIPILNEQCSVMVRNPMRWMDLYDGDDSCPDDDDGDDYYDYGDEDDLW